MSLAWHHIVITLLGHTLVDCVFRGQLFSQVVFISIFKPRVMLSYQPNFLGPSTFNSKFIWCFFVLCSLHSIPVQVVLLDIVTGGGYFGWFSICNFLSNLVIQRIVGSREASNVFCVLFAQFLIWAFFWVGRSAPISWFTISRSFGHIL